MKVSNYLTSGESVVEQVSAFDNGYETSSSKMGDLVCTPLRLVYIQDDRVTDISLNQVNSIEYSGLSYRTDFFGWGIGLMIIGAILYFSRNLILPVNFDDTIILLFAAGFFLLLGVAIIINGLSLRRAKLIVHTPSKTYEFASKESDLIKIGHAVRTFEMDG